MLSCLDIAGIREAASHTHSLWGRQLPFEGHLRRILDSLAMLDGGMAYLGRRNPAGQLTGSCKAYHLHLNTPAGLIPTLGIGAVFVPPDHRGQGSGRDLMERTLDLARSIPARMALLFSDIDPAYYEQLGFVAFPAQDFTAELASLPEADPLETRAATESDMPRLLEWHRLDAEAAADVWPQRNARSHRFFRWFNDADTDLVLMDRGQAVGFLSLSRPAESLCLHEWAAPGVAPSRVWATLRRLGTTAGRSRICGWHRLDRTEPWMCLAGRPGAVPMLASLESSLVIDPAWNVHCTLNDHY